TVPTVATTPAPAAKNQRSAKNAIPAAAPRPAVDDAERERARRAAEAEAAALREMLNRPRKVLKAPEPDAAGLSGTLHKPAAKGAKKDGKPAPGDAKKTIKAAEVSSSWTEDGSRKKPSSK